MQLVITNCDDIQFIYYILRFIAKYLLSNCNRAETIKINNYLKTLPKYKDYSCREIIRLAAYNLECKKIQDRYIIAINANKKLFSSHAKLNDLCRLINYGTMSVKGFPIFTEAFNYARDNIDLLYYKYTRGF